MTYSIGALDRATGDLGVAVQTRWFGVDAWVPWVEAGVGAVATQSFTEPGHGFHGLPRDAEARDAFARATSVESRSGEHLRRFAEAGHLPGGDDTLRRLGLA